MKKSDLINRILFPVISVFIILIFIFMVIVSITEKNNNDTLTKNQLENVEYLFDQLIENKAKILQANIEYVKTDSIIKNAWLSKDKNLLVQYCTPVFNKLHNEYKITHLYFIDTNDICFLRVHNQKKFGDKITRFSFKQAKETQNSSYGIELGSLGIFTLRYVHPWYIKGEFIGYIEQGMEIEYFSKEIKKMLDLDLMFDDLAQEICSYSQKGSRQM